jgi:hypothetical protein
MRREVKALARLSPWLLLSLLLAALLWSVDLTTTSGLFQSPPEGSPPPGPEGATITPTLTLTPTLEPAATAQPTPTLELSPTVTATPVVTPTAVPEPTVSPPEEEGGSPETPEAGSERYAEEDAALAFEWGMLFDSVALMASYAWLCCGVLVFVSIPILFVVLWVAARRRQQSEE